MKEIKIVVNGNEENEKKFESLTGDERLELLTETMDSITKILVFSGVPTDTFPSILRAQAALLEDKFKEIIERGKQ
jgi:hypothetical protein